MRISTTRGGTHAAIERGFAVHARCFGVPG